MVDLSIACNSVVSGPFAEATDRFALGPLVRTPNPALDWIYGAAHKDYKKLPHRL
ncbi:BZ3500_MvSof-1268-A1-R1_Chr7-3g09680 [Microbotryum saponariae]|uniref:BZ3500_MvSof-1268-A1-R1_Chr7-3g09680 protein n=1 Tax=Microbotryum saponariae TaxID=289078 RepID=A0A2X0KVJ6_9BASI|nr:BZ3501_MvSof-1269-A2-R1_Chr7-2g09403 [Microbotryum saponariae]SDA02402.1 BZ3500_MvSof-1268-A1-R1_Chr7-3g09680 [Microbotryum saponariae]